MEKRRLVIEIPYAGLGDHLFHSHLPRIAKETNKFDEVFISEKSPYRHSDYKKLVWEINPYVDGFIDEKGLTCDLQKIVSKIHVNSTFNLLDEIMFAFGLDNGKKWNEPEIYYKPKFIREYNYKIFDPNFLSWVGNVIPEDAMIFLKKQDFQIEKVMKQRSEKFLFIPDDKTEFITTETLFDFCDLISSSSKLFCLTSGTATIAAALGKPAIVLYGKEQPIGFRHSTIHNYFEIRTTKWFKIKKKVNSFLKFSHNG